MPAPTLAQSAEAFWAMVGVITSGVMTMIGLLVSGLLIQRQIRLQGSSHIITAMSILDEKWQSDCYLNARQIYCENYHTISDRHDDPLSDIICIFFEDLGTFVRRKALPIDIVYECYSHAITHYYEMSKDVITAMTKNVRSDFYTEFTFLNDRIIEIGKKNGIDLKQSVNITRFIELELGRIHAYRGLRGLSPTAAQNGEHTIRVEELNAHYQAHNQW